MSKLQPAFPISTDGWRQAVFLLLGPGFAYGLPAACLVGTGEWLGGAGIPLLPSGVALSLLLALGWRALPGILVGALGVGCWWTIAGTVPQGPPQFFWPIVVPASAGLQAASSYWLARRVSPGAFSPASTWESVRFLLLCAPLAGALGAGVMGLAGLLYSGLPPVLLVMGAASWWLFDLVACLALTSFCLGFMSNAPRPFAPFSLVAALATAALGAAVLFGWLTRDPLLIQVAPGLTPMQFNTALGLLIAGGGLAALLLALPFAPALAGLGLVGLGAATLAQYATGWNLGIDELFLDHYITINTTFAGRMAPNTALCFVLFGLALLRASRAMPGDTMAGTLNSIVASLGLVTLLSYAAGIDSAYAWARMTPMAVHTAAGFFALGVGGVAREVLQTEGLSRRVSLSPLPTGVALAAAALWVWQAVHHDEQFKIRRLVVDRAADIIRLIDTEITYHNHAIDQMAGRWRFHGPSERAEWTADAQAHLRDFPTIAALAWADETGRINWLEPLEGYEEIVGFNLTSHPQGQAVIERIRATGEQQATDVVRISSIGQGFIVMSPVEHNGAPSGFIAGLYRIDRLFEVLSPAAIQNYQFRVLEHDREVFHSDAGEAWPTAAPDGMLIEAAMQGEKWRLQLMPREHWLAAQRSRLPVMILFAGLFLSIAATAVLYLLESARSRYDQMQLGEHRLRQIIASAPVGMIIVDGDGAILQANPAAEHQFGYGDGGLTGQAVETLLPGLRKSWDLDGPGDNGPARPESGPGPHGVRRDGVHFPVEIARAPFESRHGQQMLLMVTDITERDEARRKLEAHSRALELINRDLDDFAYVASHDLRAPLTAIASLVGWLEEDAGALLPEASQGHLALIGNRVKRMARLLEDLLEYSRAGRTNSAVEPVDVTELIHQIVDLHQGARPLEVHTGDLPALATARVPLHQIFRNLISNAIKHHDGERCAIRVNAIRQNGYFEFCVEDDGPGIPRAFHHKVFNMFQTLRPRDEVEGSGMGLPLVRKLVERYGGLVWIAGREGRGTAVYFTWPEHMDGA